MVPGLKHVLVTGSGPVPPGTIALGPALADASAEFVIPPTDPEDLALLHFTSGTTGKPKGAMHVHQAVVAHHASARFALDLREGDVFWCTADPGWVTGTSYGIIAPLTHGATLVTDAGDFDARRWYQILSEQRVSVWYTAPTALRMMMRHGAELARQYDLSALRLVASVGEPLNPEVVTWGVEALGMPVHDNWWQTETGAIMISNFPAMEIRPGSMGRPLPGVEATLLKRGKDGRAHVTDGKVEVLTEPGTEGELALRPGWPSMFRGYLHEPERYAEAFVGGWYLTGDIARRDRDGYFWFVARADDVIKSAGYLIGPFEVESVLMEHPAVAEAGVIGKPDRAGSYGVVSWAVDGVDVAAVEHAARRAAEAVRGGGGPHFLELRTYRFRAHSMYDPDRYRDKAEVERWKARDPITALTVQLKQDGQLTEHDLEVFDKEITAEIAQAADAADTEPLEDLTKFVYSPRPT